MDCSDCSKNHVACVTDCAASHPGGGVMYRLCIAGCYAKLAGCYALCVGEELADDALEAAKALGRAIERGLEWLHDHPEVVVGTIIIIAGITLVVVATGGTGLTLAPAALAAA